jgi:hypothetical protein
VRRHDTLWSIAETTLDDGRRWKEIRDLNNGRTMSDGHDFTMETDQLSLGWLLILPGDATIADAGSGGGPVSHDARWWLEAAKSKPCNPAGFLSVSTSPTRARSP